MEELRVAFIHGVGEEKADFAAKARARLLEACARRAVALRSTSVHWAPIADRPEEEFLAECARLGHSTNPTSKLFVKTFADALVYPNPLGVQMRYEIFELIDRAVETFRGKPGWFITHSLGALLASDYLRARPHVQNVRVLSMAPNVGLFTAAGKIPFVPVPQLMRPPAEHRPWISVWDKRDMLGYPLSGDKALAPFVKEVRVSLGGLFRGWTGFCHTLYWGDGPLFSKTIPDLLDV